MFKVCDCCKLPITGDSYYLAMAKGDISNCVPKELCKECSTAITGLMDKRSKVDNENCMVLKTDNTILTKHGFLRVVRSLLDGNSIDEISSYYGLDSRIVVSAILPIYRTLQDNPDMTNSEILKLRPIKLPQGRITNYKFNNGVSKDMTNFLVLYKQGTWKLCEISTNVQINISFLEEFILYYSKTTEGRNVILDLVGKKLDNHEHIEGIAHDIGVPIDIVLDYAALLTYGNSFVIPNRITQNILQMYETGRYSTGDISGCLGCPYDWVLYTVIRYHVPTEVRCRTVKEKK